jgi:hypothetical protein
LGAKLQIILHCEYKIKRFFANITCNELQKNTTFAFCLLGKNSIMPEENIKCLPYGASNFGRLILGNYYSAAKARHIELPESNANPYHFFTTKEAALTVALLRPPCGAIPQADELKNKIADESAPWKLPAMQQTKTKPPIFYTPDHEI